MVPTLREVRGDPRRVRRAVWLSGALCGLQVTDPIIASLALPEAGRELDFTAARLALAASIATLCLAATVVLMGTISDRYGRRPVTLWFTIGLAAADLIVSLIPVTPAYMLGRAVAGICGGGLVATSFAFVRTVSPRDRLGANLGVWGALSFAIAIPLSVAGAAAASVSWHWAFLCIPAVALATIPLQRAWLPPVPRHPARPQLWGVSIAGIGVVGILVGVSQAATVLISPRSVAPAAAGVVLLAVAATIGRRSVRPAFPVDIFRSPAFQAAVVSGVLWNLSTGVVQLQSSNLWQYVAGATPLTASLLQLPVCAAVVLSSVIAGRRLSAGASPKVIIPAGLLVSAAGFAAMSVFGGSPLTVAFTVALAVVGLGAGFTAVPQSQILIKEAPPEFLTPVAASRTTFGQVGYALGLAGGSVITTQLTVLMLHTPLVRGDLDEFLASHPTTSEEDPQHAQLIERVSAAYTDGFRAGMWAWAGIFVVGAALAILLLRRRPRPLPGAGEPEHPDQ